ncbi:MAG: SIMPL domain-containing protein [Candidatus Kaelpia aquatica]|nr:SIMPL domain-containing protein [Candidatus Kaelpia aquatica]
MKGIGELKNIQIIILGLCIVCATVFSTVILSKGVIQVKKLTEEIIEVSGSAEKDIVSDYIVWTSELRRRDIELKDAYAQLKDDLKKVKAYLLSKGIKDGEIVVSQVKNVTLYKKTEEGHNTNEIEGYLVAQEIEVRSYDVNKITDISRQSTELLDQGIQFMSDAPEYFYTSLSDLKIEMLARATENAKERAVRIAASTGSKIGVIRSAKMGTFQINPINSYDVSWYGNHDTSSLEKKVIAIVHAKFGVE